MYFRLLAEAYGTCGGGGGGGGVGDCALYSCIHANIFCYSNIGVGVHEILQVNTQQDNFDKKTKIEMVLPESLLEYSQILQKF